MPPNNGNAPRIAEKPAQAEPVNNIKISNKEATELDNNKEFNDILHLPGLTNRTYTRQLKKVLNEIPYIVLYDLRLTGAKVAHRDSPYAFEDLPIEKKGCVLIYLITLSNLFILVKSL